MGVINVENFLKFKSSQPLFDRIKKRLSSFDSMGLLDDGDFSKHVVYILEQLGQAAYKECEAILTVNDFKARIPTNFKIFHAAYRCTFKWNRNPPSINEQRPFFFYTDTEISRICGPDSCGAQCIQDHGKTKIVIRTFVNGEDHIGTSHGHPKLLMLSPNVKEMCTDDCLSLDHHHNGHHQGYHSHDEIGVDSNIKHIITRFNDDKIHLQYYGWAMDEFELPMIPDNEFIEKAIEYYIYTQLFEEWYWNGTIQDIVRMLADARQQYDFHIGMARSWAKLPSFQKMVQAIRRQRGNRKFYQFAFDKTRG